MIPDCGHFVLGGRGIYIYPLNTMAGQGGSGLETRQFAQVHTGVQKVHGVFSYAGECVRSHDHEELLYSPTWLDAHDIVDYQTLILLRVL